jgi:lauroyl/myristoyl acyltransferase
MINFPITFFQLNRFGYSAIRRARNFLEVLKLRRQLRPMQAQTLSGISHALKTGRFHSKWIYLQSLFAYVRFGQHYAERSLRSSDEVLTEARQIIIEGECYAEAALATVRPLLIATIHMGDFQMGFLRLMERFRPARKMFLFKLNAGDQKETALMKAFEHVVAAPTVLRVNEGGGKAAYLALRQSHIVVLTIDIEVQVKSRSLVDFFGKSCYMQNGPATIAALSRSLVLPVVTFKNDKGHKVVRIEPVIDTDANMQDETIQQRIDRVTQQLAYYMQRWLINAPGQAHVWTAIVNTMAKPLPIASHAVMSNPEARS